MTDHLCRALLLSSIIAGVALGQIATSAPARPPTTNPATNPTANQTTRPADLPEIKPIRESAKAFIRALFGGDVKSLQAEFAGTKEDFEPVRALHGSFAATRELSAALDGKFPRKPGERAKISLDGGAEYLQENIDDMMEVNVTGDTAEIATTFKLRKIDGKWRVVDFGGTDKADMATFAAATTKVMKATLADLVDGKYKSREEVEAAVMKPPMGGGDIEGVGRDMEAK